MRQPASSECAGSQSKNSLGRGDSSVAVKPITHSIPAHAFECRSATNPVRQSAFTVEKRTCILEEASRV